jgi:hypothetical protein
MVIKYYKSRFKCVFHIFLHHVIPEKHSGKTTMTITSLVEKYPVCQTATRRSPRDKWIGAKVNVQQGSIGPFHQNLRWVIS